MTITMQTWEYVTVIMIQLGEISFGKTKANIFARTCTTWEDLRQSKTFLEK